MANIYIYICAYKQLDSIRKNVSYCFFVTNNVNDSCCWGYCVSVILHLVMFYSIYFNMNYNFLTNKLEYCLSINSWLLPCHFIKVWVKIDIEWWEIYSWIYKLQLCCNRYRLLSVIYKYICILSAYRRNHKNIELNWKCIDVD